AGPFVPQVVRSEGKPSPQLPEPWFVGTGGGAKTSVGQVGVWVCIVSAVEEIEQFEPNLEADAFCDRKIFVDVGVCLEEVRPSELHRLFIAFLPETRNSEVGLWHRANQPCLVVMRLL